MAAKHLKTYVTRDRTQPIDVGQEILDCPIRRYELYSILLEEVDLFIFLGGSDGVLRLGLLCHFLKRPFVAITAFGGAAKELGDSFYSFVHGYEHYRNLRRDDCLHLGSPNLTGRQLYAIVDRGLRPRLLLATLEVLTGRMTVRDFLSAVGEALAQLTDFLGKAVVAAGIAAALFLFFREQVAGLFNSVLVILDRLGIVQLP